jgi:hypothetical protein
MAGGGCHARKRAQPAPLGFFPLQRMRIRKSTNPGFPIPGLFPSQRFSRSQGLTPSGTVVGLFHPTNAPGVPPEGPGTGSAPLSGLLSRWPCLSIAWAARRSPSAFAATLWSFLPKDSAPVRGPARPEGTRFSNLVVLARQSSLTHGQPFGRVEPISRQPGPASAPVTRCFCGTSLLRSARRHFSVRSGRRQLK